MKVLGQMIRDWFTVKVAKNPDPDLEKRINDQRAKLHNEVQLLRLSSKELVSKSTELRNNIMDELIKDVASHRQ